MIKLIACDIDGTLLQGEEHEIAPVIFREILRLHEKGILFCPTSGRQYDSMRRLFAPVADKLFYICENGAVVYGPGNTGEILGKTVMERSLAMELCWDILAIPGCEVLISGANTSYICPKKQDYIDHIRYFVGNNTAVIPSPEAVPEDILKVSAYCRNGAQQEVPLLTPKWETYFSAAVAGEKWLDFTLADKSTGIRQLCDALDIVPEQIIAFGDNYNDVPMLEIAGLPYIMDGAVADLHSRFPNHCRRVEDVLKTL